MASKALLRYLGVEYPKEHDVGEGLVAIQEKLPDYLRAEMPKLRELLTELAGLRGPAFYGYEREGVPASKIFDRELATRILKDVEYLVALCLRPIVR